MKNKVEDCLYKRHNLVVCVKILTKNWLSTNFEREHQSSKSKPKTLKNSSNNNNNTTIKNEICSSPQQPKIDNENNNENHANIFIGPRNVGKFY